MALAPSSTFAATSSADVHSTASHDFLQSSVRPNGTYPEIADAIGSQALDDFVVDGEIVAFDGDVTSFSRLQRRMQITDPVAAGLTGVEVFYYIFDVPHLAGYDMTAVGLRHRKVVLAGALSFDDPLRFTTHRDTEGEAVYQEACAKGWEGVIAKRADSPYVQRRSTDWLKFKCVNRQEFVIGGFTDPRGSRVGFGALLVGYYEDGDLRYAGKAGSGTTPAHCTVRHPHIARAR